MTVTSIDLAMDNYTQVEKIGAKSAVHVLAILKPSQTEIIPDRNGPPVHPYYREITYPLGAGVPPNPEYYQPVDIPRTKIYSHARQSEPIGNHAVPVLEDTSKSSEAPTEGSESVPSNEDSVEANGAPHPTESTVQITNRQNAPRKEWLSERDIQATRTFAILQMLQVGENPWDLGSRLLNLKTIMGTGLLDWFLPIRRSPCCNDEDAESQYALGPAVDLLKSSVGFVPPRETENPRRRRRRKRTHQRRSSNYSTDAGAQTSDPAVISNPPNPSIPLQKFNNASTSPQPT